MENKPLNLCSVSMGTVQSASVTPRMFRVIKEYAGKTKFGEEKKPTKHVASAIMVKLAGAPARPVSLTNISWI